MIEESRRLKLRGLETHLTIQQHACVDCLIVVRTADHRKPWINVLCFVSTIPSGPMAPQYSPRNLQVACDHPAQKNISNVFRAALPARARVGSKTSFHQVGVP